MKTLTAILAVFVLGTFAVGQSRPTASLTAADKPAIIVQRVMVLLDMLMLTLLSSKSRDRAQCPVFR